MVERTHMWACACLTLLWAVFAFSSNANAQSTVIYQDDFESAVSGWTDNSTDFAPAVTNFLGRFADGQTTTSRTFTVPAGSDELVIEFDLYRFDSWDNQAAFGFDRFELEINSTEIFSLPFLNPQAARSGTTGNVDWSHSPLTGRQELGFVSGEFWFDQLHRFEVTVNNPGASVTLTLRAALSQDESDESAGYDNFLVTANPPTTVVAGSSFCPVGTNAIPGTYHVLSATGGSNPNRAVGAPLAEGSQDTGANSGITFFPSVVYDLTNDPAILVPEGSVIEVSLAGNFNNSGSVAVSSALDNTNFPAAGSTGSQTFSFNNTNNTFEYFDYTVPAGGARFMELDHLSGGIRFDGVVFDTICTLPPDVPIVAEDDSGSVADSSLGNTPVLNVLDNDTVDGTTPTVFDLALAPGETLPTGLTFDTSTGAVEVLQDTLTGDYNFDYQLCQAGSSTNCEIATVTIMVMNPNPPSICPIGQTPMAGAFHVVGVTPVNGSPNNPNGALGAPLAEGSQDNNSAATGVTFFQSLIYDLTGDPDITVPEGTAIDVSFANHFNSNPTANISTSLDGNSYTSLGSSSGPWTNNTFRYDEYIVPAGGARFMEVGFGGGGGLRFDGVTYGTQCEGSAPATSLTGSKSVAVYDPTGAGLYALPGNDVIYTISIDNPGTGDVDSGSLVLIDNMPGEVNFFNGDIDDGGPETDAVTFQDTGGGLTFDINTDVGYSNAATKPANFADCTYVPATGYDPNVSYVCFNPKGVMQAQSTWSVSFRAQIE